MPMGQAITARLLRHDSPLAPEEAGEQGAGFDVSAQPNGRRGQALFPLPWSGAQRSETRVSSPDPLSHAPCLFVDSLLSNGYSTYLNCLLRRHDRQ